MKSRYVLFSIVTIVLVALDQITKVLTVRNIQLDRGEVVVIDDIFSLVHWENTGAAFSVLDQFEHRMLFFGVFTVVALGVLLHMLWQLTDKERFQVTALGVLAAGAVGNGIDRAYKQSVTDFLKFYAGKPPALKAWFVDNFHTNVWPAFNVADICIVVGLGLFIVDWIFLQKDDEGVEPEPPDKALEV